HPAAGRSRGSAAAATAAAASAASAASGDADLRGRLGDLGDGYMSGSAASAASAASGARARTVSILEAGVAPVGPPVIGPGREKRGEAPLLLFPGRKSFWGPKPFICRHFRVKELP